MAVATREYRAEARFQRVSPQKARLVLELIKGRGVQEALDTAAFTKKRIAPVVHKLLTSAVDNAKYVAGEEGIDLDVDNLYVKLAVANDGPRMKRIRPAPMGRAYRYQRRLTHIILSVAERESATGLVTKVEEPAVEAQQTKKAAGKEDGAEGSKSEIEQAGSYEEGKEEELVRRPKAGPAATSQEEVRQISLREF